MFKVVFQTQYRVKEGRKWVEKTSVFEEFVRDEASARLRALALNWHIVSIEKVEN